LIVDRLKEFWYDSRVRPTTASSLLGQENRGGPETTSLDFAHQVMEGDVAMLAETPDTAQLIEQATRGDGQARHDLLVRHRSRLRQMVVLRMDRQLSARVDPSDVVQDALAEAHRTMDDYLQRRPLPFYPWLRRLAWQRLIQLHRQHVGAGRRSLMRERGIDLGLPDQSAMMLANRLVASGTNPSRHAIREETRERVRAVLDALAPRDREVLVLRFLEQLSTAETAAVLEIGEGAVKSRLMRAVARFRELLDDEEAEGNLQ
jgi:RNA polymerase sigma-70 factor (ECF subfamily)